MTTPAPSVSPELKALMRRVKLGRLLDTLPERLTLARQHNLTHTEFLEQLFSDEVQRRDWACTGLTDIHHVGRRPGEDVHHGDRGAQEASPASLVQSGVQS